MSTYHLTPRGARYRRERRPPGPMHAAHETVDTCAHMHERRDMTAEHTLRMEKMVFLDRVDGRIVEVCILCEYPLERVRREKWHFACRRCRRADWYKTPMLKPHLPSGPNQRERRVFAVRGCHQPRRAMGA